MNVAYMAQRRGRQRGVSVQCFNCKELGHIARNCSKKFCNYFKKEVHVIKECHLRPQNRQGFTVQSKLGVAYMAAAAVSSPSAPESSSSVSSSSSTLTPEMVQQMIISAFSALGISGKKNKLNFPLDSAHNKQWLMDSVVSNHMTSSENGLYNVRKYMGNQHIQVVNGDNLPILSIGNLGSYFKNIFVSLKLSTSLLSVGQMIENNCEIHFDRHGCCVQD
jgi:hypothetical protein